MPYIKLDPKAIHLNKRDGDAGCDLYSIEVTKVAARGNQLIKIGLGVELLTNTFGVLHQLQAFHCIIDYNYRGEIQVLLINHSDKDCLIGEGDNIAQLIIQKIENTIPILISKLSKTERGTFRVRIDFQT